MDAVSKFITPADRVALKEATDKAIDKCGMSLAEIAKFTRLDSGTLCRSASPNYSNMLPIDDAIVLDRLSGHDFILREMARQRGFELVPLKPSQRIVSLMRDAGNVARETGELTSEIINAQTDDNLTPREARAIDQQAMDVEGIVASIRRKVQGVMASVR